ncbi:MAG TPA: MBL fold metallo-hydrolase [Dehalococcoidia bacterium]|nr:MBL fold metallo-hydrolase [Dehalococcoidia bacterium]
MNVTPFVHEGLGNSSYLVEVGDGEAMVIDPDRAIARYVAAAEARGRRIVAAFETHLHADFVSGATALAAGSDATAYVPHGAEARFPHQPLAAGQRVRLAGVEVEAIASPGHTPEHLSHLLRRPAGPPLLFSGGSLLAGGAARTDLIAPEQTEALTRAQYATITTAFAALPDETLLLPTHGGGSFCSAGAGAERTSTLGRERASNLLLAVPDVEMFVRDFPRTFPAAPEYFFRLRAVNQAGPRLRREIPLPRPLSPETFAAASGDALVVDVRPKEAYHVGHIPGALSIPFRDAYATWLGWLTPAETPLRFVTDGVPLERVVDESLLVGYERFAGWLDGGMAAWAAAGLPLRRSPLVQAAAARAQLLAGALALDVREPGEYAAGHLPEALHVPLGRLAGELSRLPRDRPLVVYCGHGERAATAVSLLERAGFAGPLLNLDGGIGSWIAAGLSAA